MKDVTSSSVVSICFERGGKMASSVDTAVVVNMDGSKEVATTATSLSLVVTMYKEESTGLFQPKEGTLIVRQKKKTALGGTGYKGIGMIDIDIDIFPD
jgi:hypothetical protein